MLLAVADDLASLCGAAHNLGAAMLGHQHLAVRARLAQLLIQLAQRLAQIVGLVLLVLGLSGEAGHQLVVTQRPLKSRASQIVVALLDGQFRLAPPFGCLFDMLGALLPEQMLVGDGDGHLRLHLHQLILHVQHDLFQQPLRILGLLNKVVQICAEQRAYSFQQCHDVLLLLSFQLPARFLCFERARLQPCRSIEKRNLGL